MRNLQLKVLISLLKSLVGSPKALDLSLKGLFGSLDVLVLLLKLAKFLLSERKSISRCPKALVLSVLDGPVILLKLLVLLLLEHKSILQAPNI